MKKVIFVLGLLLITLAPASTAYAGSLNSYEDEVIAAAKQIYSYEGENYQVDTEFINELVNYLSADDIDLDAGQRDEVLQMAFSNIEQGISDGYLIRITDQTVIYDTEDKDNGNDSGQETGNSGDNKNTQKDTSSGDKAGNDTSSGDKATGNTTGSQSDQTNSPTKDNQTTDTQGITPQEKVNELLNGSKSGTSSNINKDQEVSEDGIIVKNTGFDFQNTVIMIAGMVLLMLAGIYVTKRYNLFAHQNE